jgi:chorismate synthase
MNCFGKNINLTTFGESHNTAIGGVIDGFPTGFLVDFEQINFELNRRKTDSYTFTSQRKENSEIEFLSGIFDGKTLGTPIAFIIKNTDANSVDYDNTKNLFRNGHADFSYFKKYGIYDYRGGGRASARETVVRVVAGSLAKQFLAKKGIFFVSYVSQLGQIVENKHYTELDFLQMEKNNFPTPDSQTAKKMLLEIEQAKEMADSVGGVVTCIIKGVIAGVGAPIFDKLQARLAYAMLSIPAVKGFDYGLGFNSAEKRGSEMNDEFILKNGMITTKTNNCGGILGGISTGSDIYLRVAFKPASSIGLLQQTVDLQGNPQTYKITGRHDVCFVPRSLPIVEAMAALVILDSI